MFVRHSVAKSPHILGDDDCGAYITEKSGTKLHLAHATGKRKQEIADELMKKVKERGKTPSKDNKADFAIDM